MAKVDRKLLRIGNKTIIYAMKGNSFLPSVLPIKSSGESQTVTQDSVFNNTNNFYNAVVNLKVIENSVFNNTNNFYNAVVTLNTLTVTQDSVFNNTNNFYNAVVKLRVIENSVFNNTNNFYNAVVNLKVIESSVFNNTNNFYNAVVTLNTLTVTQNSVFNNTNNFYNAVVTLNTITVTQDSVFNNTNNFYNDVVNLKVIENSVFNNTDNFYSGSIIPGVVRITQLRRCENDSLLYLYGEILGGEESMYANLVTKSDYKSYMGINSNNQDAIIDFLIPKVSNFVKSYCRRTFNDYISTPKSEYFNGGIPFYQVQEQPIISVTGLFYSTNYGQTYTALEEFADYVIDESLIVPINAAEFPYVLKGYKLVYNAGFSPVPDDLTLAVYDLMSYYIKNDAAVNAIKRTNTTSMQIEYITDTALPSNIKRVLDLYILDYY